MSIGVCDSGLWYQDFDGQISYRGLCDSNRLSDLTGLAVIDDFPSRDVAAGGSGNYLEALPLWLLLADRNRRIADKTTVLVAMGAETHCFLMPPSDGLDANIPPIQIASVPGQRFFDELVSHCSPPNNPLPSYEFLFADGLRIEPLIARWKKILAEPNQTTSKLALEQNLVDAATDFVSLHPIELSSLFHSAVVFVLDSAKDLLRKKSKLDASPTNRIWIATHPVLEATIVSQLTRMHLQSSVASLSNHGLEYQSLQSVVAALLGLMHIDQMQANIPWLTGAKHPKILGRITPGSPANWQNLLRDMVDFHPPSMSLKDAI